MLGDGLANSGQKGSYFRYQFASLKLLEAIMGGVVPPGGLATELTLLQVLAALQNGQEFEQNLVIDTGDPSCGVSGCPTYLQVRVWDTVTHTFGPPRYFDANGVEFFLGGNPLYGPMKIVNPQYVLENILVQVTAINADLDVALSTRASEVTLAGIKTQTDLLNFIATALEVTVTSSALPAGGATSALQVTGNASLASIAAEDFATETTLAALNAKVFANFGAIADAIRVAAQLGNATGSADFNVGIPTVQTLRTTEASVSRTPTMLRATAAGAASVPALSRAASFFNASSTAIATVLGAVLRPGEQVTFEAGMNDVLTIIAYNADSTVVGGGDLLITYVS